MHAKNAILEVCEGVYTLFFPPICRCCDRRVDSSKAIICEDCWNSLKTVPLWRIDQLNDRETSCYIDSVIAIYQFDGLVQKIIHLLKYQSVISIGREIGVRVGEIVSSRFVNIKGGSLVPIPLHPARLRERGYNQAEIIAKGISERTGLTIRRDIIKRVKNTISQTNLNAEERKSNMENAFALMKNTDNENIAKVILVDDVFTTGSTMNSAAKVLKEGGVGTIIGLAVATPV